jgi:DNA repair exonuclease SbcCD ATPase subunit
MDELLEKLFSAGILTEDTQTEIQNEFQTLLSEATEEAKIVAAAEMKATLSEQWNTEREALVEAIETNVSDFLAKEIEELKEDIAAFRDLELEYAEKLVEAKSKMKEDLEADLTNLVDELDTFLEMRLNKEVTALSESIEEHKQNVFGRKVFKAMVEEFQENFSVDDDTKERLTETKERLNETEKSLLETEQKLDEITRKVKLESVLAPLEGRSREIMSAILENVATDSLEDGYETFIGKVLKEGAEPEVETTTDLNESVNDETTDATDALLENGVITTGDTITDEAADEKSDLNESVSEFEKAKEMLLKQAGII